MDDTAQPLRRATRVLTASQWQAERAVGTVTLAFDDRHRRRMRMTDDAGAAFLLDLPRAVALVDGDGLDLGAAGILRVVAAEEDLAEAHCHSQEHFARICWHLGNRHLPVQIVGGTVLLRRDHVIEDMLRGLGAHVRAVRAPFQPEGGAYAHAGGHGHHHPDPHGHDD